ncbi:MAG: hypothetical protein OXU19_12450 [bacterium]|nr:hypothetical protein [bacterium]
MGYIACSTKCEEEPPTTKTSSGLMDPQTAVADCRARFGSQGTTVLSSQQQVSERFVFFSHLGTFQRIDLHAPQQRPGEDGATPSPKRVILIR